MDKLVEDVIPLAIAEEFKEATFVRTVGSIQETSMGCDNNHIGKRNCEHAN